MFSNYLDPYTVLAALGFGTFLFNIIYALLNRSARSVDVSDMDVPLQMSDMAESAIQTFLADAPPVGQVNY